MAELCVVHFRHHPSPLVAGFVREATQLAAEARATDEVVEDQI